MSDVELVERIQSNKNADDFGVLYDRFSERVYHKCIALIKDVDTAKDLTHDIFLKVFLGLSKLEHAKAFSTWMYRITYSMCMDHLRGNQKAPTYSDDEVDLTEQVDDNSEEQLFAMKVEHLTAVLDLLAPEDKAVLLMKYQDDHSIKEMTEILQVSESAVKMRTKRAREKAVEIYNERLQNNDWT